LQGKMRELSESMRAGRRGDGTGQKESGKGSGRWGGSLPNLVLKKVPGSERKGRRKTDKNGGKEHEKVE